MKVAVASTPVRSVKSDLLVLPVFEEDHRLPSALPAAAAKSLTSLLTRQGFKGKAGKTALTGSPSGLRASRVLLVGMGSRRGDLLEATRRAAGTGAGKLQETLSSSLAVVPPDPTPAASADALALAAAEGCLLASYSFTTHKTAANKKADGGLATVIASRDASRALKIQLQRVQSVASAVSFCRDLGNEPSNVMTPAELSNRARTLARKGITCEVLGPAEIRKRGMGAYLAVALGSHDEPRFIHLTYKPGSKASGRRIALVGKGLTFDSGGISIKPSAGMEEMKFDMCGAAAVLGVFHCLPELGLNHEVHGFVAACANMPSGTAVKPGDIVTSMTGRTIEVINTDAEGRLTLVDAISEALKVRPDCVVDLATLTGACAVALGPATGIMANDDGLRAALVASSDATGERAWPLPLFTDYKSQLKSDFADVKNLGDRYGGALTAGLFLQEWVPAGMPWAHMDIAGSAWTLAELPYCPKGATGIGVRTLVHWLSHLT